MFTKLIEKLGAAAPKSNTDALVDACKDLKTSIHS